MSRIDWQREREAEPAYKVVLRAILLLYASYVLCPIRYWAIGPGLDNSWVFASNYASANGLWNGRDIFWTSGPIGWLVFPQNIGDNIAQALRFHSVLWAIVLMVLADVILLAKFSLRNIVLFCLALALSSSLYWFNYVGFDNLLLCLVLLLLTVYRWRGGRLRYVVALILIGIMPLIKLTGAMFGAAALLGFLVDRFFVLGRRAVADFLLAACIPGSVFLGLASAMFGAGAIFKYLVVSLEISRGYSAALSIDASDFQAYSFIAVLVLLLALLCWQFRVKFETARFLILLLLVPFMIAAKHGFVRGGGLHTANFFCFAAMILGVLYLSSSLSGVRLRLALVSLAAFGFVWYQNVVPILGARATIGFATGIEALSLVTTVLGGLPNLRQELDAREKPYFEAAKIEREIRATIGTSEMATLSHTFNWAQSDGLRLKLFPVIQRYNTYTPMLDHLDADWLNAKGPQYLVFDGDTMDQRYIFAETPATWQQVFRWYDLRQLAPRNVLLERRREARFAKLQTISLKKASLHNPLAVPKMDRPVFLSVKCALNPTGRIRDLLLSIPAIHMVFDGGGESTSLRVVLDAMAEPALVNVMPQKLKDFATLLQDDLSIRNLRPIETLRFEGPGLAYYQPECEFEFLRPAPVSTP